MVEKRKLVIDQDVVFIILKDGKTWVGTYNTKEDAEDMISFFKECDKNVNENHLYVIKTEYWDKED